MSIWATIEGVVVIRKDKHFSLSKWCTECFDEHYLQEESNDNYANSSCNHQTIHITFCAEAGDAVKGVEEWLSGIPGHVDVETKIRWIK